MSMVHDNIIKSYCVDFDLEMFVMKTVFYTNDEVVEKTDVIFNGYFTHNFGNECKGSVIFDIEEYPLELFLEQEHELL